MFRTCDNLGLAKDYDVRIMLTDAYLRIANRGHGSGSTQSFRCCEVCCCGAEKSWGPELGWRARRWEGSGDRIEDRALWAPILCPRAWSKGKRHGHFALIFLVTCFGPSILGSFFLDGPRGGLFSAERRRPFFLHFAGWRKNERPPLPLFQHQQPTPFFLHFTM